MKALVKAESAVGLKLQDIEVPNSILTIFLLRLKKQQFVALICISGIGINGQVIQ